MMCLRPISSVEAIKMRKCKAFKSPPPVFCHLFSSVQFTTSHSTGAALSFSLHLSLSLRALDEDDSL